MKETSFAFRDFSCDLVDRPAVGKASMHEIKRSRTTGTSVKSIDWQ
jgi:hypothetical protein